LDQAEERALLQRWHARSKGDPADPALEAEVQQIWASCHRKVEGWLRKRLDDEQTAAELAQETLAVAWSKFETWEGRGRYSTWLVSFAKHLLWNRWREGGREDLTADGLVPETGLPATSLARLTQLEREALLYEVASEVLDPAAQQIFALKYVEGMTHAAIAEQLGLAGPEQVTALLKACRGDLEVRLRQALRDRGHGSSFWQTRS
jgi:RNA polymerase sigma factor (sigma-70 family)